MALIPRSNTPKISDTVNTDHPKLAKFHPTGGFHTTGGFHRKNLHGMRPLHKARFFYYPLPLCFNVFINTHCTSF